MKRYAVTEEQYEFLHAAFMERTKFWYNDAEYIRSEAIRNRAVAILESIHATSLPELPAVEEVKILCGCGDIYPYPVHDGLVDVGAENQIMCANCAMAAPSEEDEARLADVLTRLNARAKALPSTEEAETCECIPGYINRECMNCKHVNLGGADFPCSECAGIRGLPHFTLKSGRGVMDTEYTDNPICPHCGHEHRRWYEFFYDGDEDAEGVYCDSCGGEFNIAMHKSFSFTTKKPESGRE